MYKKFAEVRKTLKLSQKAFAEKLGILQTTYSSIEQGDSKIRDVYIIALCSVFNVNKNWLLYDKGEMFNIKSSIEDNFFDIYKQFSPDLQQCLLNFSIELLNIQKNERGD